MRWSKFGREEVHRMYDYKQEFSDNVNILGQSYRIEFLAEDKDSKFDDVDGYIDPTIHLIRVAFLQPTKDSVQDLSTYAKKVMRHEIVHAYLYESGLAESSSSVDNWATNEEMVDWISRQFPKMKRTMEALNCL